MRRQRLAQALGGRLARRIAIALAIVLALLIVADRVGVRIAQRVAADTIQSSQHLPSRPSVDISGFPFLTQLATGNYGRVTVTAHEVPVGHTVPQLVVSQVRVVLHDLSISADFHHMHAKSATATALITYSDLGKRLGLQIGYAGGGRIKATKTLSFAGVSVHAAVTTTPQLNGTSVAFTDTSVVGGGTLVNDIANSFGSVLDIPLPLQDLRFQVHPRKLVVGPTGLVLTLTGQNLSYAR